MRCNYDCKNCSLFSSDECQIKARETFVKLAHGAFLKYCMHDCSEQDICVGSDCPYRDPYAIFEKVFNNNLNELIDYAIEDYLTNYLQRRINSCYMEDWQSLV